MPQHTKRAGRLPAARRAKNRAGAVPSDFAELRQRANQGDPKAQSVLKQWLDSQPEVWRKIGDLAHHAQMEFTRLVTKGDFVFGEAIRRRADEMRREIAGPFPTPLELLVVERVVAAWLQVQHVEGQIALADAEIPRAKFWLQRQLQANRLLHTATKSLLLIRELLPPDGPPAGLADNGTAHATLNGKNRLSIGGNGDGSAHHRTTGPAKQINGTAKNGKHQALATA